MKKYLGIGIGVALIVIAVLFSLVTNEQELVIVDQSNTDESELNEEVIIVDEPQTSGREISVEFAESVELESP